MSTAFEDEVVRGVWTTPLTTFHFDHQSSTLNRIAPVRPQYSGA